MNNVTTTTIKAFSVVLFVLLLTTAYAAATTTVSITNATVGLGDTVTIPIMVNNITNYGTGTIWMWYNYSVVHVTDVTSSLESQVASKYIDNSIGYTSISASNSYGVSGNITFANVEFTAVGSGSSPLNLTVASLYDTTPASIQTNVSNGLITVADVDLYPCSIDFSPAWMSNATDITVRLFNNGTVDACNFSVNVTMTSDCADPNCPWTNITNTSVCANAYTNVTVTSPPLWHCCNYTVNVTLNDDPETVSESDRCNNSKIRTFHAIPVKLKVTHHYGNMSTYNGTLSGNKSVVMFDLYKNVTNYTTPYKLLTSETDVLLMADGFNISGINRSCASSPNMSTWYLNRSTGGEDPECPSGRPIDWHLFVNGVPTPNMTCRMYDYTLSCGDVVHMDLLKHVNSGNNTTHFKPRPIMDFPEPFKHGYNGTFNDTTIVYPSNDPGGDYAALAADIRDNLVKNCSTHCINLSKHVHIRTDATVGNNKSTHHLILIGTMQDNSLIALANANHSEIGMPMYFDSNGWLIDDWLYNSDDPDVLDCCSKKNSSYHSTVMACDNPFDNADTTDSWNNTNLTMWIASGVTDCYAKDFAAMLTIGCNQSLWDYKGFWNRSRTTNDGSGGCGDVNGDCRVTTGDITLLLDVVIGAPGKTIATSEWAADVTGDCRVTTGDVTLLLDVVIGAPGKTLNCCSGC